MDSVDSEHARNPEYTGWNPRYAGWNSGYADTYPDSKYAGNARNPWYTWYTGDFGHAGWNPRCAGFAGCTQQSRPERQVVLV